MELRDGDTRRTSESGKWVGYSKLIPFSAIVSFLAIVGSVDVLDAGE
jgi:hypothetical protein